MPQQQNPPRPRSAAEICKKALLTDGGQKLLREDLTARQFLDLLWDKEQYVDAIHFMAQALPKRAAVWWGCLCLWLTIRPDEPPDEMKSALAGAVQWVQDPSEENRRAAGVAGQAAKMQTAAGCLAMAAFFSDMSLNPPDQPKVPPPPELTGQTVANAVMMAGFLGDKTQFQRRQRRFLSLALDVAQGNNRWKLPA
ncbi:MAG TPA: hypothetical protein VG826_14465 [Pirellulales bacterium]|nr:hypothetical protein [Pirellulales bacterium]